tara:strand:- start:1884 stop:2147 length:264 start_codon:yes stop_codon:yes gene_type:complete
MKKLIKNFILNIVKKELETLEKVAGKASLFQRIENLEEELRNDMQELDYKIDDKLDADEYDFDDFVRGESLNDLIRDELQAIENEKG